MVNDFQPISIMEHRAPSYIPRFSYHKDAKKAKRQKRAIKFLERTNCLGVPLQQVKTFHLSTGKLNDKIFNLIHGLGLLEYPRPTRLILGRDAYEELLSDFNCYMKLNHGLTYHENDQIKCYGLTVEICPWMQGYIILP